jgi:SAM-dependent methyltransferase
MNHPAPARARRRWPWALLALGAVLNGLRLRTRLRALATVEPVTDAAPDDDYVLLAAPGVYVDDITLAAATAHARAKDLDVLDLVPGDLDVERSYELVRLVDPATFRTDPLVTGRGAQHATVVHRDVLTRAGIEPSRALDPVAYLHVTAELKRYAARSTDLAVVPGLRAVPEALDRRRSYLAALYSKAMPAVVAVPAAHHVALAAAIAVAPAWGLAALAAHLVQPLVAFRGAPVRPADLGPASLLTRPARAIARTLATVAGHWDPPVVATGAESAREQEEAYRELLAAGTERFFEPRAHTCPLCGSTALSTRVVTPDLLQFKPGTFELDGCGHCGHVFQNPRLSVEGLDFYYRDFYDGMGGEQLEMVFSSDDTSYRGRADLVAAHARPKRWLDVGGGHGHFCLVAKGLLPDTTFDGLDLSDSIAAAERRHWIDRGYVGLFPDLADDLHGAYDVVSMHHYLEHTRDPGAELDAAAVVLEEGGHLLIEVPDPECRSARLLGPLWGPWFQPQHQHFVSVGNLTSMLEARGFTVVAVERAEAHQPVDLAFALLLLTNRLAGHPAKPWTGPISNLARLRRAACFTVLSPVMVAALLIDRAVGPFISRRGFSNTYRLLARRA